MILQSLKEYYERKRTLAHEGFQLQNIEFIIILKEDGTPISINSTIEGEGKDKRAKKFIVPQAHKRTSNIQANLLWDNAEYALGIVSKGNETKANERHKNFIENINKLDINSDSGLRAVHNFLTIDSKHKLIFELDGFDELKKNNNDNVSFGLSGSPCQLILEHTHVQEAYLSFLNSNKQNKKQPNSAACIISGEKQKIQRLHQNIKGVQGTKKSGGNIVSFNCKSFCSFGKKQGENAPTGESTAFAYTTALNELLSKDSKQKIRIGETTTIVFWAEKAPQFESEIYDIFGEPLEDNPDSGVKAVKNMYCSVHQGIPYKDEDNSKFYVLALLPNEARIGIRFFIVDTVKEMSKKIEEHFCDIEIIDNFSSNKNNKHALKTLLINSIAIEEKSENLPHNIVGEVIRSIFEGAPYPSTLLLATIQRIRTERKVSAARASLIKAFINRQSRFRNSTNKEELKVSLDKNNVNIGYLLGRLFAMLEKIQQKANPKLNTTIRERFYGSASGTPVVVFSNLMRLKKHHLSKLKQNEKIYFEKEIGELLQHINHFPPHLSLIDQGRFAVGYYHQIHEFYKKNETIPNLDVSINTGELENV